jgi:hypothetical protein
MFGGLDFSPALRGAVKQASAAAMQVSRVAANESRCISVLRQATGIKTAQQELEEMLFAWHPIFLEYALTMRR